MRSSIFMLGSVFMSGVLSSALLFGGETTVPEPVKPAPVPPAIPDASITIPATPVTPATPATPAPAESGGGEKPTPPPAPTPPTPVSPTPPTPAPAPVAPTTTLYVRLNGMPKLADIADVLAERISKNEALNTNEAFRKGTAALSRPALRFHLTNALCQICGGKEVYTGAPMHELFQSLKLTPEQWKAFLGELEATLDAVKVTVNEKREVLDYADQIFKFASDNALHLVKEKGISIMLPGGWQANQKAEGNLVMMATGPEPKDGGPRPTILIVSDELMAGLDVTTKEYMRANQIIASKQVKSIKNMVTQSLVFNGEPLECFSYNAGDDKTEMYVETYFMIRNKQGIAIQFSTLKSETEKTKPQFIEALRTLKFE